MSPRANLHRLIAVLLLLILTACSSPVPKDYAIQEGDILFQSLPHGELVDAIEGMTGSPWSHCAIVERRHGEWYVVEAIGPVKETELGNWIERGRLGYFAAYRLRQDLAVKIPAIIAAAQGYLGRPYDIHFNFSEERIYCSELIYKAVMKATGVRLGKIQRIGDLDWKPFETFIVSMEGDVPLERELITPRSLSEAPEMTKVYETPP